MMTSVLEAALGAVGELLEEDRTAVALVVVGGATLNLLGLIDRATQGVDVIARAAEPIGAMPARLAPPDPLPDALQRAIVRVARDFGLASDWINTAIARQWSQGLRRGSRTTSPGGGAGACTWAWSGGGR